MPRSTAGRVFLALGLLVVVGGLTFPTLRRVVAAVPGDRSSWVPMTHGPIPTLIHLVFLQIELNAEVKGHNKRLGAR